MGTLSTQVGRARVLVKDTDSVWFTDDQAMGMVNSILSGTIYPQLQQIQSRLVYGKTTIYTMDGCQEYTLPTNNGILRDGVWHDGEDWFLKEATEEHKTLYGHDITADQQVSNGSFETWTGPTACTAWTASASATIAKEASAYFRGTYCMKITAGDASQYVVSDAITVKEDDTRYLHFYYKNTSGDIAQYAVYDVTHSSWIVEATDLDSSTTWSSKQDVTLTIPADCNQIQVYFYAKSNGDIVWFDHVSLSSSTASENQPDAYYIDEADNFGLLWVPDDLYTIHCLYWKPLTAMSTFASDDLPWGGIWNDAIMRLLVVDMLEVKEEDNSRAGILAEIAWDKAMNATYAKGVRQLRQTSDMFSIPGV